MTFKQNTEAGYTLLELLLVIALFALFTSAVMQMPGISGHRYEALEDGLLERWLTQQLHTALYLSVPERICVTASAIEVQHWRRARWEPTGRRFETTRQQHISAASDPSYLTREYEEEGGPCFMLDGNRFWPPGQIVLSDNNRRIVMAWHE